MMILVRGKAKTRKTNYWSRKMANGWTPERQARQAELIRRWRPWEKSTGPRSPAGKAKAAQNAYKGGTRQLFRELARTLKAQRQVLDMNWRGE